MTADGATPPALASALSPRLVRSRPLWGRIAALEDATPRIRIARVEIVHGGSFRFAAGQYAHVAFGEQRPRPLSMANRPDEPLLEFHLPHSATGGAVAHMAAQLRRGDGVWVEGPCGEAWLRGAHGRPILVIAGGSGLAPAKSIVETALHAHPDRPLRLYAGARDVTEVYLSGRFRALAARCPNFRYVPVVQAGADGAGRRTVLRTGLVTDAVAADFASLAGYEAYVFGPTAMVAAAADLLRRRQVQPCDLHADDPVAAVPASLPGAAVPASLPAEPHPFDD